MIEGALWRKWVFYNIPLILFVFVLLFPFYWMITTSSSTGKIAKDTAAPSLRRPVPTPIW